MNDIVRPLAPGLVEELGRIVGPKGLTSDAETLAPLLKDWTGYYTGSTALMVSPASTAEVAAVVKACARAGAGIVPQGGNTGLVGGQLPKGDILLSLKRMNRVRDVDPMDYTITVEAGCVLADVQKAALAADRFFPLSLGAEGSCVIGGNISTNAGGINVIRYGNTRELVLGLGSEEADWILGQGPALRAHVDALEVQLMVLILVGEDLHAAILLGGKYAELNYGRDDRELLRETAMATGIVLETAVLHRKIVDQGRLEQELHTARRIQESLVTTCPPDIPGFQLALRLEGARL